MYQLCDPFQYETTTNIAPSLARVFNVSLGQEICPMQRHQSNLVFVFKARYKNLHNNFRPISVLNTISKIIENILYPQVQCSECKCFIVNMAVREEDSSLECIRICPLLLMGNVCRHCVFRFQKGLQPSMACRLVS